MKFATCLAALLLVACGGTGPKTLNLGSIRVTETDYRAEVRRLAHADDDVCRIWFAEGSEPVTAYRNLKTDGASSSDLKRAQLIVGQECDALRQESR